MIDNESLRKAVVNRIREVTEKYDASIYGSFSNDTFHLQTKNWYSLSDLDLIVKSSFLKDKQKLAGIIGLEVAKSTGLKLPVSIRERIIHDQGLTANQYWIVAAIEFFYKITINITKINLGYQYAKILLRTMGNYPYFFNPFSINEYGTSDLEISLARKCLEIKIGIRRPEEGLSLYLEKNVLRVNTFLHSMMMKLSCSKDSKMIEYISDEFYNKPDLLDDIRRKLSIGLASNNAQWN